VVPLQTHQRRGNGTPLDISSSTPPPPPQLTPPSLSQLSMVRCICPSEYGRASLGIGFLVADERVICVTPSTRVDDIDGPVDAMSSYAPPSEV
jgi:hypothetical protein